MIDISLSHATWPMRGFEEEWLEFKGWDEEFCSLDLTDTTQALYAIRRWLTDQDDPNWPECGIYQIKEACRYCLTKDLALANVWLPRIDGDANFKQYTMDHWKREMRKFYLLLWTELFPGDPYHPADLSQYRQRVDWNFVHFPHMPDMWGEPEYKPW